MKGLEGWKTVGDTLSRASEKLLPLGMRAGFHNHKLEFVPLDGKRPMEEIAAHTPKEVMLQLDVGTCVEAGSDPIAWYCPILLSPHPLSCGRKRSVSNVSPSSAASLALVEVLRAAL